MLNRQMNKTVMKGVIQEGVDTYRVKNLAADRKWVKQGNTKKAQLEGVGEKPDQKLKREQRGCTKQRNGNYRRSNSNSRCHKIQHSIEDSTVTPNI